MNKDETLEVELMADHSANERPQAIATVDQQQMTPPKPIDKLPITASQAKIDAIADLTHSAYQKAATLKITAEESDTLRKDFPDEAFKPGAAGKENLIYIEHAFLRDRFTEVFGMGTWAI